MKRFIQALSLCLFSAFFVFATYKLPAWFPADIYLRLDPLLGLNAILAAREIIGRALWSLVLLGATLFIGRFFCAYVCPMGASIDFLDRLFFRQEGPTETEGRGKPSKDQIRRSRCLHHRRPHRPFRRLLHGSHLPSHPHLYVCFLSSRHHRDQPLSRLASSGISGFRLGHPVSPSLSFNPFSTCPRITFLIFGGIIALNRLAPRFWCRYLCPLGALLSLVSPLGSFQKESQSGLQ